MTLANKKALFMYAAWCDYEFHDAVFSVFQLVTEGKLEEAAEKASSLVTQRTWLSNTHHQYMAVNKMH